MSAPIDRDPIERQLRPWLAEEGMVREPDELFDRVAGGTRSVRQRPGWVVRLLGNGIAGAGAGSAAQWREHRMATTFGLGTLVIALAIGIGGIGSGGPTDPGTAPGAVSNAPLPSASPAASQPASTDETWVTVTGLQNKLLGKMLDMSDPRLEGDVRIDYERNGPYGNDSTLWSTVTITNDEGSWVGQSVGFVDHQGRHHHMGWFKGAGAYEGLAYIEQLTESEASAGNHLDVIGLVYEGELPPMVLPAWTLDTD